LHWNEDVADDRLDRLVAFATTHNWASSDREALARLRPRSCIVDGEAVACGEDGVPSFDRIRYRQRVPVRVRSDRAQRRRLAAKLSSHGNWTLPGCGGAMPGSRLTGNAEHSAPL
jgi:hypothetical protein